MFQHMKKTYTYPHLCHSLVPAFDMEVNACCKSTVDYYQNSPKFSITEALILSMIWSLASH